MLILLPLLSLPAIPLLFLADTPAYIWLGAVCWGAALGVQQSTVRAGVATLTPEHKRGTAYGIFDSAFGLALLLGSLLLGELYSLSITWLVIAAVAFQIAALPLLFIILRRAGRRKPEHHGTGLVGSWGRARLRRGFLRFRCRACRVTVVGELHR